MIKAKYNWKLLETEPSEDFVKIVKKEKIDKIVASIMWERGVRSKSEIEAFLNPDSSQLHDPFLLHDMKKAVDRIRTAIENQEKILIYGDYDADGMTSASIMKSALDELGADELAQVYLPNRFTDGYGPNIDVYKYWIEKEAVSLIITTDNGVAGNVPIDWAQSHGCDVVVTDHHSIPEILPKAYAIVHPQHPDSFYPFDDLCGAGVAFKVACALLESIPMEMLDLVAIGTVADMVSLRPGGENRVLVSLGLHQLKNTDRSGLIHLMQLAGCDLRKLDEEAIGFQIAPRLNALGRLDDPNPAIELLTGWDEEANLEIAKFIEMKNTERKNIVEKIMLEAESMIDPNKSVEVLYHANWHKGVLGIVAGRLLEKHSKPVIMLSLDEKTGELRGSGRSVVGFNIFEALTKHRDLFKAFGGHAQACGLTIDVDKVEELRKVLNEELKFQGTNLSAKPNLQVAEEILLDEISLDTLKSLAKISPFGMGNPKPLFLLRNFKTQNIRTMGKDNSHLKMRLSQGKTQLDAVLFRQGNKAIEFEQVETELMVQVSSNTWNGQTSLQLMVEDARAVGIELVDLRSHPMTIADFQDKIGIFENNSLKNGIMNSVLLIKDAPTGKAGLEVLHNALLSENLELVYFLNQIEKSYYLNGSGSRDQYAGLFKAIYQFPEFDVRFKLGELSNYLKIPKDLLVKMIQIFEELGFVKLEDGLMSVVKNAEKREIRESKIFQELEETIRLQEFFALSSVKEIYNKLKNGETTELRYQ
ncbi:single-stranded-DNA-specific exonuclease RecJ [Lactovum miscens]|uniref:Single-stranded-DNA-specific exonuclease RecJ n=1 Tax=Lactovum miscens TaxID=190387 RepID=A0A841C6W7_9LACT|nr:single-stranded-DNA-specific exonuclease RecJ [Lactovum miscens]MBB5888084.1 single-stranded-DNA-specific exonuclease [Lactovum miscens]